MKVNRSVFAAAVAVLAFSASFAASQTTPAQQQPVQLPAQAPAPARPGAAVPPPMPAGIQPPGDYTIGPDDVLGIVFWREKDMTGDVTVRPDGKITLPLINEISAAGLRPDQLREAITQEAVKFIEDPAVTVIVKKINSRKVYITGMVEKPGTYDLIAPTTVIQFIAIAGGLKEFAHRKEIVIMRTEDGKSVTYPFNYEAIVKRTRQDQNILLKPGDTVVVP
jgi:polysaccharide export outer membrane protein